MYSCNAHMLGTVFVVVLILAVPQAPNFAGWAVGWCCSTTWRKWPNRWVRIAHLLSYSALFLISTLLFFLHDLFYMTHTAS